MKKILLTTFLFFLLFFFVKEVQAINVSSISSAETSCTQANVSASFYMSSTSGTYFLYDTYFSSTERIISKNNTNVRIWQSDSNLVT
jgi:hypothetical protein